MNTKNLDCNSEIFNYLKDGLVVNVFYLRNRIVLKQQIVDYLRNGTRSLSRKYLTQKREIKICEYRVYKVFTFFDYIRVSNYYNVFVSIHFFVLIEYLLDYILAKCTIDCTECQDFDFATHYIKNVMTTPFTSVKLLENGMFKLTEKDKFPYRKPGVQIIGRSNDNVSSMMLLDFTKMYRIVALRKICSSSYIITLFHYNENLNHIMICDFWFPKSCLPKIRGSN